MEVRSIISKGVFSIVTLFFALTVIGNAQHKGEQNKELEQLQEDLKKDYFSFGLLIKGIADFQPERTSGYNGFSASKARFKINGIFENRFGYNLQATMLKSPSILDANVYYKPTSNITVKTGLFKSPFTHEYLTGAGSILFVKRSKVVNRLGTKRQIGVQLDGFSANRFLRYTAGIFNGNNYGSNHNDDSYFQYIGRLEANLVNDGSYNAAKVGVNISYEQKDTPSSSGNIQATFEGEQTLIGSYFSIKQKKLLLDGEFIYSWLNSNLNQEYNPYGYYATVGYSITSKNQLLLRWDTFSGDNLATNSKSLIAGFNYKPSKFAKLKLNYILPTEKSTKYSQLLASMQISF